MNKWFVAFCYYLFLIGCNDIPRDSEETLNKVKIEKVLHVGLIHNPPWVNIRPSSPTGIEIKLIQSFADYLNVTPKWHVVNMEEAAHLLEKGALNLLAGGLVESMPYKKVGYTRPYVTTYPPHRRKQKHVLAVRLGENRFLSTLERFLKQHQQDINHKNEVPPYATGS